MDIRYKVAGVGVLAVSALYCALGAIGSITAVAESEPPASPTAEIEQSVSPQEASYVLRDYGGVVAVFLPEEEKRPLAVTDIAVEELRAADRTLLDQGIRAADRDELVSLLEDLGS